MQYNMLAADIIFIFQTKLQECDIDMTQHKLSVGLVERASSTQSTPRNFTRLLLLKALELSSVM